MSRCCALVGLIAAMVLAGCSVAGDLPGSDATSCEVYRAFYDQLPDRKAVFFRSTTLSVPPIAGVAPSQFERDTGQSETVELEAIDETIERPVREDFELDTTHFSAQLRVAASSLVGCFSDEGPPLHDGSFELLYLRERLLGRDDDGFVTVWAVSPVALSPDGVHALIYADHYCGALCAGGAFYLLQRRNEAWVVVGDRWVWVS